MATHAVTVLTTNGRRQQVKVEPNLTILDILEQVCKKHNFNADEHDLKHHNKILDLSAMFRFSGLPNNALLEMVPATKVRTESDVTLVVQLEDGSRHEGTFKPSTTLMYILKNVCEEKANAESNPVMIYMRKEVQWDSMEKTTLKSLGLTGGRAIIRLLQRTPEELKTQANVSAPLPQKEKPDEYDDPIPRRTQQPVSIEQDNNGETNIAPVPKDKPKSPTAPKKAKPSFGSPAAGPSKDKSQSAAPTSSPAEIPEPEPKPESIINIIGDREALLFHLETAERSTFEHPDSFYEITVSDVRKMYADLRKQVKELEEAPLMTSELRQLEDSKRVLNNLSRYKTTIIRVQFPDRYVLQGIFKPHESVSDVMTFVRDNLDDSTVDFYLYTTPPKELLSTENTLVEAKCVPQVLLHFGCEKEHSSGRFLKLHLYEQLSNATGATLVAARSRGRLDEIAATTTSAGSSTVSMETDDNQPETGDANEGSTSSNRMPNANFRPSSVQTASSDVKMPKWFKPVGK
ncbi:tether containing UBX domain for GLUT4 [Topomyia yanbarensis]|uniref:tether containing UBX domain for GLUT4 n=1 Tax=Topomyia yanbarensis TaxID=2498891 RepID=UPI00273C66B1|nr:tether containing UBX domain for GLUT4 [Topomyia yanbarensis]